VRFGARGGGGAQGDAGERLRAAEWGGRLGFVARSLCPGASFRSSGPTGRARARPQRDPGVGRSEAEDAAHVVAEERPGPHVGGFPAAAGRTSTPGIALAHCRPNRGRLLPRGWLLRPRVAPSAAAALRDVVRPPRRRRGRPPLRRHRGGERLPRGPRAGAACAGGGPAQPTLPSAAGRGPPSAVRSLLCVRPHQRGIWC
jgi:hypothetical protein